MGMVARRPAPCEMGPRRSIRVDCARPRGRRGTQAPRGSGRRMAARVHAWALLAAAREVVPARAQMATTLGFHIVLACFGIAFPTIVLVAEYLGLKRADAAAVKLARRWSQALVVL